MTREEEFEVDDGISLRILIEMVASKYGNEAFNYLHVKNTKRIDPSLKFLINGVTSRYLRCFKTQLREGDIVALVPPIGGG